MVGSGWWSHWSKLFAVFRRLHRLSRAAHLAEHLERRDWCHQRPCSVLIRAALEGMGLAIGRPAVG